MERVKKHLVSAILGSAVLLQAGCAISAAKPANYAQHPEAEPFIQEMAKIKNRQELLTHLRKITYELKDKN